MENRKENLYNYTSREKVDNKYFNMVHYGQCPVWDVPTEERSFIHYHCTALFIRHFALESIRYEWAEKLFICIIGETHIVLPKHLKISLCTEILCAWADIDPVQWCKKNFSGWTECSGDESKEARESKEKMLYGLHEGMKYKGKPFVWNIPSNSRTYQHYSDTIIYIRHLAPADEQPELSKKLYLCAKESRGSLAEHLFCDCCQLAYWGATGKWSNRADVMDWCKENLN